MECYSIEEELLPKLEHHLSSEGERAKIAEAGQQAVLSGHFYEHIARKILNQCVPSASEHHPD